MATGVENCRRGQVANVINFLKICPRNLELHGSKKMAFPIDSIRRTYNSVGTTVPHCDDVTVTHKSDARVHNFTLCHRYANVIEKFTQLTDLS